MEHNSNSNNDNSGNSYKHRIEKRGTLETILNRPSPFSSEKGTLPIGVFKPSCPSPLHNARVLVLGAGGLGCEILKNLAMSHVPNVEVIDSDTIEITNLNRQFLFRESDLYSSKAEVAAKFINDRCPWMKTKAHHCKVQDKKQSFYQSFHCVLSGLDNIEARRWINSVLCSLVVIDKDGDPNPDTVVPFIDGGSEGFSGQARVILPRITSCFECTLGMFPPQRTYPLCTVSESPRLPEHCIIYASKMQWPREFPDQKLDIDSLEDINWVYQQALERSQKYKIEGLTYSLTIGVMKNIIPAVASTNAVIAGMCVNEAVKLLSFCSQTLNNYMMYIGKSGVYTHTFESERKWDCPVCQSEIRDVTISSHVSLNEFMKSLKDGDLQLMRPSITAVNSGMTLYMQNPPELEKGTRPNLDKLMGDLVLNGEHLIVTDPLLSAMSMTIRITFSGECLN